MAGDKDPSLTETPDYRIVVLFAAFVAVTYLFERLTKWMNNFLKQRKRRGLLHTIHKLEEELLGLGLISLLLLAFEVRRKGNISEKRRTGNGCNDIFCHENCQWWSFSGERHP